MDEKLDDQRIQRRVILRFRTSGAPSDAQIIDAFFEHAGLRDWDCFVHWQPREYEHTHVIVDVHCGLECVGIKVNALPHEVYRVSWTSDSNL